MSKIFLKNKMHTFIKILFYLFPFMMLLESAFINSYVIILIVSILFFNYSKKIKLKFKKIDYLLFTFFLINFIASLLNIELLGKASLIKSILDFRFLILFILIKNLIENKLVNLKFLFLLTLVCTTFLSLDIIYQHIIGKDFFGNPPFDGRFNGTFEHEAIAGSYLQKNFLIASLSILVFARDKMKNKNIFFLLSTVTILMGLGILLSFDRMPFIIYLFTIILLIFFLKKNRLLYLFNFLIISLFFVFLFNNYKLLNNRYASLSNEFNKSKIANIFSIKNHEIEQINYIKKNEKFFSGDYSKIYKTAYYVWLKNPITGSGARSFKKMCEHIKVKNSNFICSTHPHNIYLEIITNQGIAGLLIFIVFLITLFFNLKKIIQKKSNDFIINILFLIILITELWPLRSYGSIYSTINGSMFWFILALASSNKFKIK